MIRRVFPLFILTGCFHEAADLGDAESSSTSTPAASTTTSTTSSTSEADTTSSSSEVTSSEGASGADTTESSSDSESSTTEHVILDYAVYFGGSSVMQSQDDIDLNFDTDFTVELWARRDSADATGTMVCHRGVGTVGWKLVWDQSSALLFGVYDNNGALHVVHGSDAGELAPGWHHIAATKQGTSLRLFVDGNLDATAATVAGLSTPVVPLVVGDGGDDGPLIGIAVDDVRVSSIVRYDGAFTPPDELMVDSATRVLLPLDEGDGEASLDLAADLSFSLTEPVWTPGNTET